MTNDELKAIKSRADAATAGPWEAEVRQDRSDDEPRVYGINTAYDDPDCDPKYPRRIRLVETDSGYYPPKREDAEFMAHARTDVPALVAEVERWQLSEDDRDDLSSALGIYADHCLTCSQQAFARGATEEEQKYHEAAGMRVLALARRLLGGPR